MSVQLRDYQEEAIAKLRGSLRSHRSVLLTVPTGGGKTVLAAFMAGSAAAKGLRVWFVCHRDFLIDQTSQTFSKVGIDHAFIAAGWTFQPHKKVQICSIDTLRNRLDRLTPPDLLILDEGQHACAGSWKKIATWAGSSKIVGLSGSPCRLDGKGLGDVFDDLVMGPTMAWLMQHGHLSQYKAYAPSTPDLTGVHTRAGDYAAGELDAACNRQSLVGDIVRHYQVYARGLKAIYFGCSIAHSERIASTFRDNGIGAAHIDGTTPSAERKAAARALARGEISVISNCSLAFEGYDLAAQAGMDVSIDCVGLCRPTQSLSLHLQMLGRGLRPSAGKSHAVILDHAGNLAKHGLPDDEREWSLAGQSKKKKAGDEPAVPLAQCPKCFFCHRPCPKCPSCGHAYMASVKKEIEEVEGDLKEIDKEALRRDRAREQAQAQTLDALIELGRSRGHKKPEAWAAHVWTARQGKYQQGARR